MPMARTLCLVTAVAITASASQALATPPFQQIRRPVPTAPPALFVAATAGRAATAQADQQAQAADVLVSALSLYTPPACSGIFLDVACPGGFAVNWIEQFYHDGITAGCGGGDYCPSNPVTRAEMAVFVEKTMRGTSNWPPHTVLAFHHPAAETNSNVNSGTELLALVAAIPSTGAEAPSPANPWLIRLGPGIFDLGTGALQLPANVALEGAGQDITALVASGYNLVGLGTLVLAGSNVVRDLSVYNTGNATYDIAVVANGPTNRFTHVIVYATSSSSASGTAIGLYVGSSATAVVDNTEITATNAFNTYGVESIGGYVQNIHTSVFAYGANASGASYAMYCSGGDLAVSGASWISASNGTQPVAIHVDGTGGADIEIRDSFIDAYDNNTVGALDLDGAIAILQNDDVYSWQNAIRTSNYATVEINNSRVFGGSTWITNGSTVFTRAGGSLLAGTTSNSGSLVCGANYNGSYASLGNACP